MKANKRTMLAVDLGGSSGRVIAGHFDGERITLEELHRFTNTPVTVEGTLHWDWPALLDAIMEGIRKGVSQYEVASIGVDSWGVDYGLIDAHGDLLSPPINYRDARTEGMQDWVFNNVMSRSEVYNRTGIQFLPFNTIYQLAAHRQTRPRELERAGTLMMIADLVHYHLTGFCGVEYTNASTTQLLDARKRDWDDELIGALGLSRHLFPELVAPGSKIGKVRADLLSGCANLPEVIAVATHDTGSAVAAVPAATEHFAYISSGTWSLLGTELSQPCISEAAYRESFTNEGGIENTLRFLKNIGGLWLLQESRNQWEREGTTWGFAELGELSGNSVPFRSFVDPDAPEFLAPGDMPGRISEYCRRTGQPPPTDVGQFVRCIHESLAMKYRYVLEKLEGITGEKAEAVHIVGGGTQDQVLCQATANALGRTVLAGPVEATALGNIGAQLMAFGNISNRSELRRVIARSFPLVSYAPSETDQWESAFQRFRAMIDPT